MNSTIWKQTDSRWASKPYPVAKRSTVGGTGCGLLACTHVAMEQERYKNWTPENLRPWMVKQGYAEIGNGTKWEGITNTLKHIGHKSVVRIYSDPMSEAWKELNKGNRIGVILFNSRLAPNKVRWTASGHYVAFTNYKVKDGKHYFYTKDSGGRNHSGWYTYENSMKGCISKMWIVERVGAQTNSSATVKTTSSVTASTYKPTTAYKGKLPTSVVKSGSKGASAKAVQQFLNWCINSNLTVDGVVGAKTVSAIKIYQKTYGLTVDGAFGNASLAKAKKVIAQYTPKSAPVNTTKTTETKSVYKVIDVSSWQGKIDWKKVKAAGIDGAIIRYADGTSMIDSYFDTNMKNAKAAGLHIGCYIFSRAKTKAAAEKEAINLYNAAKKYNPDMPLYIDLEWNTAAKHANTVASAFITKMKALGGCPGIYANLNWFNNYITTKNYTSYPLWIAQYNSKITHKNPSWFGMWQYTSSGSVNGISGRVDMNKCYVAYWNQNKTTITTTPTTTTTTKTTATATATTTAKAAAVEIEIKPTIEPEKVQEPIKVENSKTSEKALTGYTGTLPTLTLKKTNAEVIKDTIRWAYWIAGDNSFHYGSGSAAHHNGCYFCDTNTLSGGRAKTGIVDYKKSYCCNPFVGAAWAHGGCDQTAYGLCKKGTSWDYHKGKGYDSSSLFTNLGHPAKSSLKAGDVLCRDTHVALYVGDGKIAHAGHEDDNVKNSAKWNSSIEVTTLTDANYKNFPRVHRYKGSVNVTNFAIRHGEISERVKLWQKYLNWYFGSAVCTEDGYYGDGTLKWTKTFQEEVIGKGEGDGIIGPKTLEAAKNVKK